MFKGVCTALITPFNKNGSIDYTSLENLIEFQINNSVDALLVCGTTGEPPTIEKSEQEELISFVIKKVNSRVPVIVGCGSNSTKQVIEKANFAKKMGADGILVVTPYYNKCTQDGLVNHFKTVNDAVDIKIIAYNVPGRTGVNIGVDAAVKLSKMSNIVGLKEASGNLSQITNIKSKADPSMSLFSGDDSLTLSMLALGCDGVISVASNVIPKQMHDIVTFFNKNEIEKARKLHFKYNEFMNAIFVEVNPTPIKYAANLMGLCENILRQPLEPLTDQNCNYIEKIMKELKLV